MKFIPPPQARSSTCIYIKQDELNFETGEVDE